MVAQQSRPETGPPPELTENGGGIGGRVIYHHPDQDPYGGDNLHDEEDEFDERSSPHQRSRGQKDRRRPAVPSSPSGVKHSDLLCAMEPTAMSDMQGMFGNNLTAMTEDEVDDEYSVRPQPNDWKSAREVGLLRSPQMAKDSELHGVFEKRSPWWVSGWRNRAYILKGSKLMYFKEERSDQPLGALDFKLVPFDLNCVWLLDHTGGEDETKRCCDDCCDTKQDNFDVFYLKPLLFENMKLFCFRGPRDEIRHLATMIAQQIKANAYRFIKPDPLNEKLVINLQNFWRYPLIHEDDFLDQVESGDLMLFKGTDRAAKMQRRLTGSNYDHVGLLLRTVDDQVLLLEATGRHGVNTVPWALFKAWKWHQVYDWIAYRKVYFKRNTTQLTALQEYVCGIMGRPYALNVKKLLNRADSLSFDGNGRIIGGEAEDADRTFFCSELCAACLKRCGVIKSAKSSQYYWPSTFAQNGEPIELHEGVRIGEEQVIVYA